MALLITTAFCDRCDFFIELSNKPFSHYDVDSGKIHFLDFPHQVNKAATVSIVKQFISKSDNSLPPRGIADLKYEKNADGHVDIRCLEAGDFEHSCSKEEKHVNISDIFTKTAWRRKETICTLIFSPEPQLRKRITIEF